MVDKVIGGGGMISATFRDSFHLSFTIHKSSEVKKSVICKMVWDRIR